MTCAIKHRTQNTQWKNKKPHVVCSIYLSIWNFKGRSILGEIVIAIEMSANVV